MQIHSIRYASTVYAMIHVPIISPAGTPCIHHELWQEFYTRPHHITVLKNSFAKTAFSGTELEVLSSTLEGPSAIVTGGESAVDIARTLVDWAKKIKQLELKAAILDGELFEGADGVKRLSDYPTKDEAQATVIQLVLSPAGNVVISATSPGSNLLGIVKEIESRLEEGNTIEKIA